MTKASRFPIPELHPVELAVFAFAGQQGRVGTLLDDAAVDHHGDAVGALDGRKPVGDDKGGAPLHEIDQGLLHQHLGLGVEGRGGFVKDQDRGIFNQGPGDAQPLFLTPGKSSAQLADGRVQAQGHRLNEVQGVGRLGRGEDFGLAGVRPAVGDVVAHRVVEEDRLLGHHGDLVAQGGQGETTDVDAVDGDRPAARVEKARDEVDQGRLASPAHPHQGQDLAFGHRQIDPFENPCVIVAEPDVFEGHPVGAARQMDGIRGFDDVRTGFQDVENPVGGRQPLLKDVVEPGDLFDRIVEHQHRRHEGKEGAGGGSAVDHLAAAVPDDKGDAQASEELHDRRREAAGNHGAHFHFEKGLGLFLETGLFMGLAAEGLDDLVAGDSFVQKDIQVGHGLLAAGGGPTHPAAELDHREKSHGQDHQGEDGHFPVPVEDDPDQPQNGERVFQAAGHGKRNHGLDHIHIVGDAAHEDPGLLFLKKGDRQVLDPIVEPGSQPQDDALAHEAHQVFLGVHARAAQQVDNDHRRRDQRQHALVAAEKNIVQDRFDQVGRAGRGGGDDQHTDHRQSESAPVFTHQCDQLAVAPAKLSGKREVHVENLVGRIFVFAIIFWAMAARRSVAPGGPNRRRTSARAARIRSRLAGSSSRAAMLRATASGLASS